MKKIGFTLVLLPAFVASAALKVGHKTSTPIPGSQLFSITDGGKYSSGQVAEVVAHDLGMPQEVKTSTVNVALKDLADQGASSLSLKDIKKIQSFAKLNSASVYEIASGHDSRYYLLISASKNLALSLQKP